MKNKRPPLKMRSQKSIRDILKDQKLKEISPEELPENKAIIEEYDKAIIEEYDEESDGHSQDGSEEVEQMEDLLTAADAIVQEMEGEPQ
jgi:hypothetical protein